MIRLKCTIAMLLSLLFLFCSIASAQSINSLKINPKTTLTATKISPMAQGALVTKKNACDKNAKDNVAWYKAWNENDCGLTFNGSNDYNYYFNKCMKGEPVDLKERQEALAICICKKYSAKAVEQNKERIAKKCPAEPSPSWWNSDPSYHYNWCIRGANPLKAEAMNKQREEALKRICIKKEKEKKTEIKNETLTLFKNSDPGATFADVPYSGTIKPLKDAKLKKITNTSPYTMTFLSGFNSSSSAAKCSTVGTTITMKFKLFPGQTQIFSSDNLSGGKLFFVCTNSKNETILKLNFEYEITY